MGENDAWKVTHRRGLVRLLGNLLPLLLGEVKVAHHAENAGAATAHARFLVGDPWVVEDFLRMASERETARCGEAGVQGGGVQGSQRNRM